MGKIENVAAEMCADGIALEEHSMCTIFNDALPAEYEARPGIWPLATISCEKS